jgi:hypothetical protein
MANVKRRGVKRKVLAFSAIIIVSLLLSQVALVSINETNTIMNKSVSKSNIISFTNSSSSNLPVLVGTVEMANTNSISFPARNSIYVYGYVNDAQLYGGYLSTGNETTATAAGANTGDQISISKSNSTMVMNNECLNWELGGFAVSNFVGFKSFYGFNVNQGAPNSSYSGPTNATVNFTLTSDSLVVFLALASAQQYGNISGIPGLIMDNNTFSHGQFQEEEMMIAHDYLGKGNYSAQETSRALVSQLYSNMADLIGVFIFTSATQVNPQAWNVEMAYSNSISFPAGNSIYVYGYVNGAQYYGGYLSSGNETTATAASGNNGDQISVSKNNNSTVIDNACLNWELGGFAISAFSGFKSFYGYNENLGAPNSAYSGSTNATVNFTLTSNSLVIFLALASAQQYGNISGIPGLIMDKNTYSDCGFQKEEMMIAHAYLGKGSYSAKETSKALVYQLYAHMADLIGVFVFTSATLITPQVSNYIWIIVAAVIVAGVIITVVSLLVSARPSKRRKRRKEIYF